MDLHLYATFAIIAVTIVAFALERWPMEGVSLASLTAIILLFGLFPYTPEGEFFAVDKILGHRTRGTGVEFRVSWVGYPAKYNKYIGPEFFASGDTVREYCASKGIEVPAGTPA